jgi:hypothetical protein
MKIPICCSIIIRRDKISLNLDLIYLHCGQVLTKVSVLSLLQNYCSLNYDLDFSVCGCIYIYLFFISFCQSWLMFLFG